MPAAGHETDVGRLDRFGLQCARHHVAVEVVHGYEREPARRGQRLGARHADEQRPDQSRSTGHGHPVDLVEANVRALERVARDRVDELEVPP